MKKLVFMFVAVAAGQQAQPAQVDTDTIEEVVDSVIDTLAVDTAAADTAAAE